MYRHCRSRHRHMKTEYYLHQYPEASEYLSMEIYKKQRKRLLRRYFRMFSHSKRPWFQHNSGFAKQDCRYGNSVSFNENTDAAKPNASWFDWNNEAIKQKLETYFDKKTLDQWFNEHRYTTFEMKPTQQSCAKSATTTDKSGKKSKSEASATVEFNNSDNSRYTENNGKLDLDDDYDIDFITLRKKPKKNTASSTDIKNSKMSETTGNDSKESSETFQQNKSNASRSDIENPLSNTTADTLASRDNKVSVDKQKREAIIDEEKYHNEELNNIKSHDAHKRLKNSVETEDTCVDKDQFGFRKSEKKVDSYKNLEPTFNETNSKSRKNQSESMSSTLMSDFTRKENNATNSINGEPLYSKTIYNSDFVVGQVLDNDIFQNTKNSVREQDSKSNKESTFSGLKKKSDSCKKYESVIADRNISSPIQTWKDISTEYTILTPTQKTIYTLTPPFNQDTVVQDLITTLSNLESPEKYIKAIKKLESQGWSIVGGSKTGNLVVFERKLNGKKKRLTYLFKVTLGATGAVVIVFLGLLATVQVPDTTIHKQRKE